MARRWNKIATVSCLVVRNAVEKLTTELLVSVWRPIDYHIYNDQAPTTPWGRQMMHFQLEPPLNDTDLSGPFSGPYAIVYQDALSTGGECVAGGNMGGNVGGNVEVNVGGSVGGPR